MFYKFLSDGQKNGGGVRRKGSFKNGMWFRRCARLPYLKNL